MKYYDLAQIIIDSCATTLEHGSYPDSLEEMIEANESYEEIGVLEVLSGVSANVLN